MPFPNALGKGMRGETNLEKRKILVIEDEKPIAEILKYGFEKEGFEVFCSGTGAEGLKAA